MSHEFAWSSAVGDDHFAKEFAFARNVRSHQPAACQCSGVGTRCPGRPFRAFQWCGVREQLEYFIGELEFVTFSMLTRELLPIVRSPAPRKYARQGVAFGASVQERFICGGTFVMNAALRFVHNGLAFLWCQSVSVTEVFHNVTGVILRYGNASGAQHSLQNDLPAFRRGALVGDALHHAMVIHCMAGAALSNYCGVSNGNTNEEK